MCGRLERLAPVSVCRQSSRVLECELTPATSVLVAVPKYFTHRGPLYGTNPRDIRRQWLSSLEWWCRSIDMFGFVRGPAVRVVRPAAAAADDRRGDNAHQLFWHVPVDALARHTQRARCSVTDNSPSHSRQPCRPTTNAALLPINSSLSILLEVVLVCLLEVEVEIAVKYILYIRFVLDTHIWDAQAWHVLTIKVTHISICHSHVKSISRMSFPIAEY